MKTINGWKWRSTSFSQSRSLRPGTDGTLRTVWSDSLRHAAANVLSLCDRAPLGSPASNCTRWWTSSVFTDTFFCTKDLCLGYWPSNWSTRTSGRSLLSPSLGTWADGSPVPPKTSSRCCWGGVPKMQCSHSVLRFFSNRFSFRTKQGVCPAVSPSRKELGSWQTVSYCWQWKWHNISLCISTRKQQILWLTSFCSVKPCSNFYFQSSWKCQQSLPQIFRLEGWKHSLCFCNSQDSKWNRFFLSHWRKHKTSYCREPHSCDVWGTISHIIFEFCNWLDNSLRTLINYAECSWSSIPHLIPMQQCGSPTTSRVLFCFWLSIGSPPLLFRKDPIWRSLRPAFKDCWIWWGSKPRHLSNRFCWHWAFGGQPRCHNRTSIHQASNFSYCERWLFS